MEIDHGYRAHSTTKGAARPVSTFLATMAAIAGIPVALSAYAQSRPVSERVCTVTHEVLWAEPVAAEVTTCRIAGVEVSRTVRPTAKTEG